MLNSIKKVSATTLMGLVLLLPQLASAADTAKQQAPVSAKQPSQESKVALAYKKEFAFLEAQKRDLQKRLVTLLESSNQQFDNEKSSLYGLENKLLSSNGDISSQKNLLLDAQRTVQENSDNQDVFTATFLQADSSLNKYNLGLEGDQAFQALADGAKVKALFKRGQNLLEALSSVHKETGSFHLLDGTKANGEIIYFGNVARFGVSEEGSGALAPAGEGLFKLWSVDNTVVGMQTALALSKGEQPKNLALFLVENSHIAVQVIHEKTMMDVIESGGVIGYIIVVFGVIALLMVFGRALFLRNASHANRGIMTDVRPLVSQNKMKEAVDICKASDGATSRVLRATIRNLDLDRDREHLEDIVSESILHESEPLDRFGTAILVVAAVAPLMGLLGTVTGMIATFDVITTFGTGDPKMLSGGISEALVTTELGLIVAIPAVLLGNLLSGWAESIKSDMELGALHLINIFKETDERASDNTAA